MTAETGVPRSELVDDAYERLLDLIVTGRLAPGAPMIETEIANRLAVSRTHLRAALERLRATGLVVTAPIGVYSRTYVAPLRAADARELFLVVGALEGLAARELAEHSADERAGVTEELRRLNEALRVSAERRPRDFIGAYRADLEFHALLIEACGLKRVQALYRSIKPQADRYERLYSNVLIDETHTSVEEHAFVIAALEAGDAERAGRAIEENWRNAADRFAGVLQDGSGDTSPEGAQD